ncbi:MAG: aminotransferase class I/II-fold pyridoxal phosphate-dependent enzyme [Actinomycetota bacterium]|nr:aminotransferase class I/II-fold pyridoxal phosphate-dependent enzyme [Actinomycetota bacterium]
MVDLRSDTLTKPSAGMLAAMSALTPADVGDDVYGEDPTVNALEARVAALFGHEAALFVPSGTMGNQLCLRLLVPPAEELICDADAHIVTYEGGGAAQHGAIQTRTLVAPRGLLDPAAVAAQLRPAGFGTVPTRAVAVEQTHNRGGGAVYPLATLVALRAAVDAAGVALHCDGARIWNAAVASGTPLSTYGGLFDTLSVCLSKGLGAPVGSLVVGSAALVAEARVLRRRLGGGMRQAGVLAAAGAYALARNLDRLAEDHARAARLAGMLADAAAHVVDPAHVQTNIVPLDLTSTGCTAIELAARTRAEGVLISVVGPDRARLVTHLDVDDAGIERAGDVVCRALTAWP